MLTDQQKRKRLHNRPTAYELIAEYGETSVLIMYCGATSRRTIMQCVHKHADALIALTGHKSIVFCKPASLGATLGPWRIRFSGRTQREAIGSELPWIGDKPA